ncbi:hypothetical protein SAMN04489724_1521 [Algoriphagus locisalis]|uniref:Uncharacterized protein n=1 Tax=Algoriphagus locisalis TaxID=305507 RepID=A0A1I6ZX49_9BACT|nr:hypothetical protein SAMN04489724_1521 [Algoriphagus locisalis]
MVQQRSNEKTWYDATSLEAAYQKKGDPTIGSPLNFKVPQLHF